MTMRGFMSGAFFEDGYVWVDHWGWDPSPNSMPKNLLRYPKISAGQGDMIVWWGGLGTSLEIWDVCFLGGLNQKIK